MQCLAEMWATVFPFAGGCGCFISWFGCNATVRSHRSSPLRRRNRKKRRNRLKPLALYHDFSYGPQGRGYKSSGHYRCLPNKLRIRLTPSILRAGCGMADQNWPTHVSDSQGDADRRGNSSLVGDGDFELTVSKGPGITLLSLRQDAGFAEFNANFTDQRWSGPTSRAPPQLRGWLGLRDQFLRAPNQKTLRYVTGNET